MNIKWSNVISKGDWIRFTILILVSIICWSWVWVEYQKPLVTEAAMSGVSHQGVKK